MMKEDRNIWERKDAARFWDNHGIDEDVEAGDEVEVSVKKPLSNIMSIRIGEDHLEKLKLLARAQDIGVTTMARRLLQQCLDNPGNQLMYQAIQEEAVQNKVSEILADSQIPPGDKDPEFFLLSSAHLETLGKMINETAARLFFRAFRESSVAVTKEEPDLYHKIKEFSKMRD